MQLFGQRERETETETETETEIQCTSASSASASPSSSASSSFWKKRTFFDPIRSPSSSLLSVAGQIVHEDILELLWNALSNLQRNDPVVAGSMHKGIVVILALALDLSYFSAY